MHAPEPLKPVADTTTWRLQLCGWPQLHAADGRQVALERRDAAMLALIAVEGHVARQRVAALLWPGEPIEQVRGRLRQRLFVLKGRAGVEIVTGKVTLGATPALTWPGLESEPAEGDFLGDDDYADLPDFADWLGPVRHRLRALRRERLAAEASLLEQQGRLAEGIVCAERLLSLEPLQEHAHRRLIRLHYLRGDRAAALLAFDRCERALKDEVGARPSPETLALLAQVERSQPLPVPAGRCVVPASVLRPPRVIGRDLEWALLQAAWERGDAVVVVGEAGMGKTRLIDELMRHHAVGPGRALQVSARPGDERVPYALIGRLLRSLLAAGTTALPDGVRAELARLLPELPQPQAQGDAAGAQARLVGAIETTLQQAMAGGLEAVTLDDLHFSDKASLELAQQLVVAAPLRWIVSLRPEAGDAALASFIDPLAIQRRGIQIRLLPLSVAQVAELLDTLALGLAASPGLPAALHRHTGGNPLFLLETLRLLLQQGGAAAHALDRLGLSRLPTADGVGRLIQGRLAQLSPMAMKLMRCAAIAGQDFDVQLAAHVLGTRPIELTDGWSELAAADVLRGDRFAHDLIQDAALASVPAPIACSLHADVAAWLEGRGGEPAHVAHHWQQAGRPDRAGPAWVEAAGRCATRGRRAEESALLQRAAEAFDQAGDTRRRFDALLRRADLLGQHAVFAVAQQALDEASAAAIDDEDRLRLSVVSVNLWGFHGDEARVLGEAPQALQRARRMGRHDAVLLLAMPYAGALSRSARATEAVELLAGLRDWVQAHAEPDLQRQYWNAFALALDLAGCMRESMRVWATAIEQAERCRSDLLCQAVGNMAYTSAKMGAVERAAELGARALALARAASDGLEQQTLEQQLALGHHLRNLGRYGEAVQLLEAAAAGFRQGQGALKVDAAEHFLSVAWLHLGQPARALRLMAGDALSQLPRVRAMRLAFRAMARHAAGQDALDTMRQALALLDDPESLWFRTHTLIATSMLPPVEAEPLATGLASWALARERFGLALAAHARAARSALAQGAPTRAVPHVEAALELAKEFHPDVYYLPELWSTAAQVHGALGREAERRAALAVGAAWVLRTAEEHVPPEFRSSFLHRNRVNADLLHAARAAAVVP